MSRTNGKFRPLLSTLLVVALVYATGCASAKKKDGAEAESGGQLNSANADESGSDTGKGGLRMVHFPYDSSLLDDQAKELLAKNAKYLKEHPQVKVQIEGHCDQRGGIQYNIALGERRAKIAKHYLEHLGIEADRISVISFGKEKPIDPGTTDEAYAKNRRDQFEITVQ